MAAAKPNPRAGKPPRPNFWNVSRQAYGLSIVLFLASGLATLLWQRQSLQKKISATELATGEWTTAQQAVQLMEDEIAQAGFDPYAASRKRPAIVPFLQQSPDTLELQGDWNLSGVIGDHKSHEVPERLVYHFDAQKKQVIRNQFPFLPAIDSLTFIFEKQKVKIQWPTKTTEILLRHASHP